MNNQPTSTINTGVAVSIKTSPQYYPIVADGSITPAMLASGVQTSLAIPVGTVFKYVGSSAPTGYLMCDGSAVSQATYASLFAVTSSTYNTGGEGVGNFRLPDLRGRVPMSDGTGSGLTARTIGQQFGTETVALNTNTLPSHTHSWGANSGNVSADHSHNPIVGLTGASYMGANFLTNTTPSPFGGFNDPVGYGGVSANHYHNFSGTSDGGTGGGAAHPNMQPSITVSYIIKY